MISHTATTTTTTTTSATTSVAKTFLDSFVTILDDMSAVDKEIVDRVFLKMMAVRNKSCEDMSPVKDAAATAETATTAAVAEAAEAASVPVPIVSRQETLNELDVPEAMPLYQESVTVEHNLVITSGGNGGDGSSSSSSQAVVSQVAGKAAVNPCPSLEPEVIPKLSRAQRRNRAAKLNLETAAAAATAKAALAVTVMKIEVTTKKACPPTQPPNIPVVQTPVQTASAKRNQRKRKAKKHGQK
ncbi:hypothetical protein BDR26DRAFT_913760 [Obelidium mucronatum]|nr:hypothetical protein BDR26DRAFT_913760 [Obelidium mucronatum]